MAGTNFSRTPKGTSIKEDNAMWETKELPATPDDTSPDGTAQIRSLPAFDTGSFAHATVPPTTTSEAAVLRGATELFYVLDGDGELWRKGTGFEETTPLYRRRCASVPPDVSVQYRAGSAGLQLLILTMPRWHRDYWQRSRVSFWPSATFVTAAPPDADAPWATKDLSTDPDEMAPDGSEIRILVQTPSGQLTHCSLPPGEVSQAVRHKTINEIWHILDGQGEVWRSNGRSEVVDVSVGTSLTIPVRTRFQFRNDGSTSLEILIATMPPWPGMSEAEPVEGLWK
jgi:mannose-6-phosphate isomerase-like protein (cupin superfamily)